MLTSGNWPWGQDLTYFKGKGHAAGHFTIHFCVLKNLIVLVVTSLADVNNTPGEAVLEPLDRLKVDIEGDGMHEGSLALLHDNIEYVD